MSAARSLLVAMLIVLSTIVSVSAENRIALVIGNSAYRDSPLANPRNDARLMAETLEKVGFEVKTVLDGDFREMKLAMVRFGRRLRSSDTVGLFYYAGHGVQARGENYLIPVDAEIVDETEISVFAINVNDYLSTMERSSSRINIVVLDACRNNPFARTFRSQSRGLARVEAPRGTYIAYATAPGQVAWDGTGENSPYTKALAQAIDTPGLTLEQTFKRARRSVLAATSDRQVPWETSSLTGSFYFQKAVSKQAIDKEEITWSVVRDSTNPSVVGTYLKQYGNGRFAPQARAIIAKLNRQREEREAAEKQERKLQELKRLEALAAAEKARREALEAAKRAEAERLAAQAVEKKRQSRLLAVRDAERRANEEAKRKRQAELADWQAIRISSDETKLKDYLSRYPSGTFSDLAQARLSEISRQRIALLQQTAPSTVELSKDRTEPETSRRLIKRDLALQIQKHLERLGCNPGRPDGSWGRKSRAAAKRFLQNSKVKLASLVPTQEMLDAVGKPKARVCPLLCGNREVLKNGRCAAKKRVPPKIRLKRTRLTKQKAKPSTKRKVRSKSKPKSSCSTKRSRWREPSCH